jgi:hypothetical protein
VHECVLGVCLQQVDGIAQSDGGSVESPKEEGDLRLRKDLCVGKVEASTGLEGGRICAWVKKRQAQG